MVLAPYAYSLLMLMVTEDGYQSLNKSRKMRNKWLSRPAGAICGGRRGEPEVGQKRCAQRVLLSPHIGAAGRAMMAGGNPQWGP
ncbi:hypothetical protein AGR7A_Cc250121 [Agrobacterium deltaense NCPPB 1641]|uniref:Uncharacterized protein n=1 Tax=Agrobacterium deltaense NCPPB 1641 TaxID=1183425 RepID=A0A1S7TN94_9HYPH|nr:hypothetical protein AGR7A_Cc250121 [Agrobacterium deltaense NCPPB 1641]